MVKEVIVSNGGNSDVINTYKDKETKDVFEFIVKRAGRLEGIVNMARPTYHFEMIYTDGEQKRYYLWLGEKGSMGTIMDVEDRHVAYTFHPDQHDKLLELLK